MPKGRKKDQRTRAARTRVAEPWKNLPLSHLKAQFERSQLTPSPSLLRALLKDKRTSARKLARSLIRHNIQEEREILRLERLLYFERILWSQGLRHVAGVDEVGLGALAGPVIACAVVMPPEMEPHLFRGVNDSKQLPAHERERLSERILHEALAVGMGSVDIEEVARLNIYHAGCEAMRRAVCDLTVSVEHVLIDGRTIPNLDVPQNSFVRGDTIDFSIAAASIVAKVHRDRLMVALDIDYPDYGFRRHMGYGTRAHWRALRRFGPCAVHRYSYEKIKHLAKRAAEREMIEVGA